MLQTSEEQQLRSLIQSPPMRSNPVRGFTVDVNAAAGGLDASFTMTDVTGIDGIDLLRGTVRDPGVATLVQHWAAAAQAFTYTDTGSDVQSNASIYYWLRLLPSGTTGKSRLIGPQSSSISPDLSAPAAPLGLSVSHDDVVNGAVKLFANVVGVPSGDSVRVLVSGYKGNAGPVSVASSLSSPLTFSLDATGEAVSFTAVSVSAAGTLSEPSAAYSLTLDNVRTAPASPSAPTIAQFAGGNQISWIASAEPWVTSYKVLRGNRGDAVSSFTVLATVIGTTAGTETYADTAGLSGDYAYAIKATAATGDSEASLAGFPARTYSATTLPPNASANQTNDAKVDSVSSSGSVLIRIYGPSGVGTGYTRTVGGASLSRPNGTISGNAYKTQYAVVYDTANKVYLAFLMTDYPSTLPDAYEFVGYYTTVSTGSASGSGATATAVIDGGGHVIPVNVTNSGSGYDNAEVDFSGGGGTDAQASANLSVFSKSVSSITVTNGGSGYTTAPTVTIVAIDPGSQPGGGGASTIYAGGARYDSNPANVNS